ncbi:hypothetical protein MU1_51300 [Paenibacillus glycanilyticus]|uniref:Uncharacterized protein n=1 Tax=Paenibacillus glycanilyticus TaxID=126569 RepID=A0ABQ6GIR4_9BACL|nr:hypothetical protein MU1_51300 [Paenibacillus glycanilyticus]
MSYKVDLYEGGSRNGTINEVAATTFYGGHLNVLDCDVYVRADVVALSEL